MELAELKLVLLCMIFPDEFLLILGQALKPIEGFLACLPPLFPFSPLAFCASCTHRQIATCASSSSLT